MDAGCTSKFFTKRKTQSPIPMRTLGYQAAAVLAAPPLARAITSRLSTLLPDDLSYFARQAL